MNSFSAAWQFCQLHYRQPKAVDIGESKGSNILLSSVESALTSLLGTERLSAAANTTDFKEKIPLHLGK